MSTVRETEPAVIVSGLRVDLDGREVNIVDEVSFEVAPGEILGLIGESGSGKTTVGTAMLGYTRPGTEISAGSVMIDGVDLLQLDERRLRSERGALVSYVPQDPGSALNPVLRIGTQLEEVLAARGVEPRSERLARIRKILEEVRLPNDDAFLKRYPHELSGGQQQRVVIAAGFVTSPKVVVLDEPTTGLDVTTQAHVLTMVRELCSSHRTAGVYVSHDLAVVAGLADRIAVMYYGRLVEIGRADEITTGAAHPYTRGLIGVIPDPDTRRELHSIPGRVTPIDERPTGCVFADRCALVQPACRAAAIPLYTVREGDDGGHVARCRRIDAVHTLPLLGGELGPREAKPAEPERGFLSIRGLGAAYDKKQVLTGIDLEVPKGLVTAIVGESGSGKTTMAQCIGGLHTQATGEVFVGGAPLTFGSKHRTREELMAVQYIFQNATQSLNPRKTIGDSLSEPLRVLRRMSRAQAEARVVELLEDVALDPRYASRYPTQLSGGERQRATIARALAADPQVLVCDEITSALDVSVQASVLALLQHLRDENGLTMLFVTHNLAVVRAIADRVAVLNQGVIVEEGPVDDVLDSPQHEYTKSLLYNTPTLSWAQ
ncbi:MAG: ABC transporter ATP-binding protein [Leucobacter sp.]|nr:ABC transporter ATP-binding protein [Leucobacter sp.]